ncbi:phage/plasmid primase, P4 family [Halodesulfovibrio aestuarii]|uniref:Phage/plasmid primase, P4 family n=1 Tax=Halodesulfovibrio aestuarii TaxID=126333 RepID=A0ABV4JW57_9BACT
MSDSKKITSPNTVDQQQHATSPSNYPSPITDNLPPATPDLTSVEVAQLSSDDLRALIQQQVEEERREVWENTKKAYPPKDNAPKRLRDDLEVPPPAVMVWKVLHVPEKRGPRIERLVEAVRRQQLGDAELLIDLIGDKFCFDHKRQQFMRFMNSHWVEDTKKQHRKEVVNMAEHFERGAKIESKKITEVQEQIEKLAKKISESEDPSKADIVAQSDKRKELSKATFNRKQFNDRADKLRNDRRTSGILNMATSGEDTLGMDGTEWDKEHTLLPCANGIIDLQTGHLLPPDPKYKMRHASKFEYRGLHEEAPFWTDFLHKVFCGKLELLEYFERVIGYAITGLDSHKEIYVAFGPSADNGKSSLFDTIMKVMGGYASVLNDSVLLQTGKKSGGPDPELLVLDGLRMAAVAEPGEGQKFNKETIKQITGSDRIRARGLYTDTIEFKPRCKLFIHTNFMPQVNGADKAFFNRLRPIPFNARFTKIKKEVDESKHIYLAMPRSLVDEKLKEEAHGILSWLVRCARTFLSDLDLTPPLIVRNSLESYTEDNDPVGTWINDWCQEHPQNPEVRTQAKILYDSFKCYCMEELNIEDKYVISNRRFGDQMKQRFERVKTNVYHYSGISIKSGFKADERPKNSTA